MMFSKYLPLFAVALVALMIVPQYVQAETITNSTIIEAESEHTGLYDEEVNIAESSSAENINTWNPASQGLWFGSSTKESLFRFNDWTAEYNDSGVWRYSEITTTSEFQFSTQQIISGISDFVIRLPFYIGPDIYQVNFGIYAIPSNTSYSLTCDITGIDLSLLDRDNTIRTTFHQWDPATGTPSTTRYYTVDNRAYYHVVAALLPNQLYLLTCSAFYYADQQFKIYFSPNDICQDKIYHSHIARFIPPTIMDPSTYTFMDSEFDLDIGFSFDMREGLGGQVTAKELHVEQYDYLFFFVYAPGINMTASYLTIHLPFYTDNGSVYIEQVYMRDYYGAGYVTDGAHWWRGDIGGGTTSTVCHSHDDDLGNYIWVKVMFGETRDIIILFNAFTKPMTQYYQAHPALAPINLTSASGFHDFSTGISYDFDLGVVCPVMLTSNQMLVWPIYNSGGMDEAPTIIFEDAHPFLAFFGMALKSIWGVVYLVTDHTFAEKAFHAGEVFIVAQTAALFGPIAGPFVADWLAGNLPGLEDWDPMAGFYGVLKNLLDAAWGSLGGLGDWLESVGEMISAVITWIVEAIMDYGAIVLGLLAIFVIVLIFFFAIWFQLKLWLIGLHLAKGDLEGAGKEGKDVAEMAGQVAGGVGKVL